MNAKKYIAEFLGTAFLLAIVVGSGIMGESLSSGNAAIALLANSIATGMGLFVLIQCVGPISGAHMNPVVSLVEMLWGRLRKGDLIPYWIAQFLGALFGVGIAHFMFDLPLMQVSGKSRETIHLFVSELVATFGLLTVIATVGKREVDRIPAAVAAYITSAYWFTSSTAFANPAVTFARAWTNTFSGIAPSGVIWFILAQLLGGVCAWKLFSARRSTK